MFCFALVKDRISEYVFSESQNYDHTKMTTFLLTTFDVLKESKKDVDNFLTTSFMRAKK